MLATLLTNLVHPDKNVRIEAALAIGTTADRAAIPALVARLGAEPDFFVRENVTWALVRMGADAVLPLLAALETPDATTRFYATHALSKLDDVRAIPSLVALLDDPSEPLVQKAIFALGRIGDPATLPTIVARLATGSRELRSTVNDALVMFGAPAVPLLAARWADADGDARHEIIETAGGIDDDAATALLVDAMRDAEADVRFAAITALRTREGAAVVTAMQSATTDDDPRVRLLAARGPQPVARRRARRTGRKA